ncbi:MAG: DUF1109 domain-containing protein [Pseudomonadota bacterium]
MPINREDMIAGLTEDLEPVRRVTPRDGALLVGFATLVSGIASISIFEFWTGMFAGEASAFFWITNGMLLLLGAASTTALVAGALPRVGARANAPGWSAAMLGLIPVAAILTILSVEATHDHSSDVPSLLYDPATWYWECGAYAFGAGAIVFLAAVMFLRQGAPVSIERSGWLTGLAAGALGSLAYGITCPLDSIAHIGIWHVMPVVAWAVVGRFAVPPLIRW